MQRLIEILRLPDKPDGDHISGDRNEKISNNSSRVARTSSMPEEAPDKDGDVSMDNISVETNSHLEDNEAGEYPHFEIESEEEVEETQFQKEQAYLSEGELYNKNRSNLFLEPGKSMILNQNHPQIADHNNLSPMGLEVSRNEWSTSHETKTTKCLNLTLSPIVSND